MTTLSILDQAREAERLPGEASAPWYVLQSFQRAITPELFVRMAENLRDLLAEAEGLREALDVDRQRAGAEPVPERACFPTARELLALLNDPTQAGRVG